MLENLQQCHLFQINRTPKIAGKVSKTLISCIIFMSMLCDLIFT